MPTNPDVPYRLVDGPEDVRPGEEVKNILTMSDSEFEVYVALLRERMEAVGRHDRP